jgi:antitoxin component YwqK of YwqJK toxin-antitoxin module
MMLFKIKIAFFVTIFYGYASNGRAQRDTTFYDSGSIESIIIKNDGKPIGKWMFFYENGSVMREERYSKNGKKIFVLENWPTGYLRKKLTLVRVTGTNEFDCNGIVESYRKDGTIFGRSKYHMGDLSGTSKAYHPNGRLFKIGKYRDGKKMGKWRYYDENGNLIPNFQEEEPSGVIER